MDWRDLATFLAAARAGSLGGAARTLRVDQATVSRRLAALERQLEVRLFDRTPEGLRLTEAGRDILPAVERMGAAADEVERKIAGADAREGGPVKVTTSEAFSLRLGRYLAPLKERHPGIEVEVVVANRALDLARREADLAIRLMSSDQGDLIQQRACVISWGLFAAPAYLARRGRPACERDLAGHDVVGFNEAMAGATGARFLAEHAGQVRVVQRANSLLAVHAAVCAGLGLGTLPVYFAGIGPPLERIGGSIGERPVYLVAHPDVLETRRVRAVFQFLLEALRADPELSIG